jgi:hypothetical protein
MKHFLSALATFKNDANILPEWIEHYKWQGFDHIYLINNASSDNFIDVLHPYIMEKFITILSIPILFNKHDNYNTALAEIHSEVDWLAVCDVDQYWYTTTGIVRDYVKDLNDANIDCINTKIKCFGSNNHIMQPESIRKGFTQLCPGLLNTKSIVKVASVLDLTSSQHLLKNGTTIKLDMDNIHVNEYSLMSLDYFLHTKLKRPSPHDATIRRTWSDFFMRTGYQTDDMLAKQVEQYTTNHLR